MLKSDCKRLDRTLWSKASNAAEISRLTRAVKEPLSIDIMSSVTLSRAVSVECNGLDRVLAGMLAYDRSSDYGYQSSVTYHWQWQHLPYG